MQTYASPALADFGIKPAIDKFNAVAGDEMQLTRIPDAEWAQVEAAALTFWDEIAAESPTKAKVVNILK